MALNILYVSQYYPPEACAPALRVSELAREWARAGHYPTVLTGFPNHPEGVLHPEYQRRWRRGFDREEHDGIKVFRTWVLPAANRGIWGRAANYCSFSLSASAIGPWIAPSQGVVIATSPQLLVGMAGYVIARARRLPFIFEVRDLWPESIAAVGAAQTDSALYRTLGHLAGFLYRKADLIVLDGEWKKRELAAAGVRPEKMAVIWNGAQETSFYALDSIEAREARARVRRMLGLNGQFVATYAGTLGMAHGLETVLEAAERLRERKDVVFLLIGEGAERDRIIRRSEELRLGNVLYLGKHPHFKIPDFLAASDACLVPLRKSEVFRTAIPSKMFESMAASKPVILGVEGEAREILTNAKAGLAVPPGNPAALSESIIRLRECNALSKELGINGRRAVSEKYSRRHQARAYIDLIAEVAQMHAAQVKVGSPVAKPLPL